MLIPCSTIGIKAIMDSDKRGSANEANQPKSTGGLSGTLRVLGIVLKARLDGRYKQNPFFVVESGIPIVTPKVFSDEELKNVKDTV
jgi:hypothetical protein